MCVGNLLSSTQLRKPVCKRNTTSRHFRRSGCRFGIKSNRSTHPTQRMQDPRSMSLTCFLTPLGTYTWATPRPTRSETSLPATGSSAATTSCTQLAGMPLDFPLRTQQSSGGWILAIGLTKTLTSKRAQCAAMPAALTGTECCRPAIRSTTAGISGCFCSFIGEVLPTAKTATSTGAQAARPCSLTSRL